VACKGFKDIAGIYLGAVDVKGDIDGATVKMSAALQAFRPAGSTFPLKLDTGGRDGAMNLEGLANGAQTAHLALPAGDTADIMCAVLPDGGDPFLAAAPTGYRFFGIRTARIETTELGLAPDKVHSAKTGIIASGAVDVGWVVSDPATSRGANANTDTAYADMGAASASGVKVYLIVPAITLGGYTSVTPKLRHSSDGNTFVDVTGGAFTAVTAASTQLLTVGVAVNRYLSIAWTWNGAGSGNSFRAFVGAAV
jgi:hypothetical protein